MNVTLTLTIQEVNEILKKAIEQKTSMAVKSFDYEISSGRGLVGVSKVSVKLDPNFNLGGFNEQKELPIYKDTGLTNYPNYCDR